ncbi:hypothetical protein [Arthrobacter sp. ES3-54]|uniref:hypothetical protein n=1 Tax=Arthrobacter sp. ES3-54 TaxID=1502991 RepID=UPI002405A281|nr:hypothetical protein [Arthrobacter sp. ES3-54]
MNERAQQLRRRQTIINKDPGPVRVPVNTFRQTTKHNFNHNNPTLVIPKAPTALDGSTVRLLSDSNYQKPDNRCHKFITEM